MFKGKNILFSFVVIAVFCLAYFRPKQVDLLALRVSVNRWWIMIFPYLWWVLLPALLLWWRLGFVTIFDALGLKKGFKTGLFVGVVLTLPMLISSAIAGSIPKQIDWPLFIRNTFYAGFFEEILFRAFLTGILFRKLGWGFIPAAVVGAVVFGTGHLYQGNNLYQSMGVFIVTAMGAAWFAWLYIEWNFNLWLPVFLHIFMNLSWMLFEVSANALGGWYANIFRAITIALSVIITLRMKKQKGLLIKRNNLLVNCTVF